MTAETPKIDPPPLEPKARTSLRNHLIFWASILLAGLLLYLALRGVDWALFLGAIREAEYAYLPLIFAWASLVYLGRSARWRVLLTGERHIRLAEVHWANMAGYLGNNLLPARAGEFIRSFYLSRSAQMSASLVLATCLVERLADMAALIVLGALSLAFLPQAPPTFQTGLVLLGLVGLAGFVFLFILARFEAFIIKMIDRLPILQSTHKDRLKGILGQFGRGLGALSGWRRGAWFGFLTLLIWLLDGTGLVFLALIFHINLNLGQALVLLASLGLAQTIPSTPGAIGIYQFVAVYVLAPFGVARESALAFILVAQGLMILTVAIWGGVASLKGYRLIR